MKTLKYFVLTLIIVCCVGFYSCSSQDDYKTFQNGKEIVYTGKVDSVQAFPGKNRIKLSWLLISDPKITGVKIYWNMQNDSTYIPITRLQGIDTMEVVLSNLSEGNYTFDIYSFDKDGNRSVKVQKSGVVYGDVYESSLLNRPLVNVSWNVGGNTFIGWGDADTSKCIGVRVIYKDNVGITHTLIVPNSSIKTELIDFDPTSNIEYSTLFKPTTSAIDTFFAPAKTKGIDAILLQNQGYPFIGANVNGRWGNLANWTINSACKNHGGIGGFDNMNTTTKGYLSIEYWGPPQIINGKISQTLNLPIGSYQFVVNISAISNELEDTHVAVAAGDSLPNVENIVSAIGSYKLTNSSLNGKQVTVSFTLTENAKITLGFVSTMKLRVESSVRSSMVRLLKIS